MAKNYSGENTLSFLISLIKQELGKKLNTSDVVNNLTSTDSTKALSAAQGKVLADMVGDAADNGDMLKSVYDTDDDGVVDNAAKLEGHAASYFATPESVSTYVTGLKGQANGLVPLQADRKIDSTYLPSYVDDVIEGYLFNGEFYEDDTHNNLIQGERGKIYVDLTTATENYSYRFSGSTYVLITSSDMVEIDNATVQSIWDAAGGASV